MDESETRPNGPDPRTGYWPGTEHLQGKRGPLRRLAKIGHEKPFATLEEGVAFWESHGYVLRDRSDSRAELESPNRGGCGLEVASCFAWFAFWPLLLLAILGVLGQTRERVVLEITSGGAVVESRSLAPFKLFGLPRPGAG